MTTFKKGDRFIPYKPINDKRWEKGMDKYEGHAFTVCDIIDCTDGLAITALENNQMFLADWCEKVGDSEIPNNHTSMKAGIEMISDEHIAENSGMDKFPIENHINPFSMLTNQLPDVGKTIDWEQRRYELAKSAMQGLIVGVRSCGESINIEQIVESSLVIANEMIKQLKEQ